MCPTGILGAKSSRSLAAPGWYARPVPSAPLCPALCSPRLVKMILLMSTFTSDPGVQSVSLNRPLCSKYGQSQFQITHLEPCSRLQLQDQLGHSELGLRLRALGLLSGFVLEQL